MTREFLRTMLTPAVLAAQQHYYGKTYKEPQPASAPDTLGPDEIEFAQLRDSFYLASVTEDGWPYMQHRGGPRASCAQCRRGNWCSPTMAATGN